MPVSKLKSKWVSGNLVFYQEAAGNGAGITFGGGTSDDFDLTFVDDGTVFADTSTTVSGSADGTHGYLTITVGSVLWS